MIGYEDVGIEQGEKHGTLQALYKGRTDPAMEHGTPLMMDSRKL